MPKESVRTSEWMDIACWVFGFLVSFFVLSTALYFLFFRGESYLFGMLAAGVIFVCGDGVKRCLK
jgi:hypothetical protein